MMPHSSTALTFNLSLQNLFRPIQITLVFIAFIFNPDMEPNISRVFNAACKDYLKPSIINVVSSANCVSLYSLFPIFMPLMFGLFWIKTDNI